MARKNKGKGTEKNKADEDDTPTSPTSPKLKPANSINVRHILVLSTQLLFEITIISANKFLQCEKHSKKEEALAKLREGAKFDEVAREFSEDKARQGRWKPKDTLVTYVEYLQGGSLGWKTRGSLLPAFEEVAYKLEISTTSNPSCGVAKTVGNGYHIIMVEGRK